MLEPMFFLPTTIGRNRVPYFASKIVILDCGSRSAHTYHVLGSRSDYHLEEDILSHHAWTDI